MKTIFLESHHLKNRFFGFGQFNFHLIKALSDLNCPNLDFVIHGKNLQDLKKEFGPGFTYKKYYPWRRYEKLCIRKKYDLWHSMNQNTGIEPFYDIPYLLTVHNITYIKDPENYKEQAVHQKFQEKLNRSNAITYISNFAKTSTHKFFDVPPVPEHIVYNGNPILEIEIPDNFKPQIQIDKPFLFSIGEFTERKNFKSLIGMLQHLPEHRLIIAGKNSTNHAAEIRKYIAELKLENRVFLPGKISETEKQYFYQHCDAFVFPSLREGFGLPIVEAMRFGKPVFTSKNTSLPEIGGELAFYWGHYDSKYMAEVFLTGMETFQKNERFYKKKSIERAKEFDWSNAAKQYLEVYRSLI